MEYGSTAHNVSAVTDVFLRPMRKNAKHFYGRKKMCWSKTAQRAFQRLAHAQLRFCGSRAAERRRSTNSPVKRSCCIHNYFSNFYIYASGKLSKI